MCGDGAVGVGALVVRGEVSELERLSKCHSIGRAHAGSGDLVGDFGRGLKEGGGGAVGGAARKVRLVPDAKGVGAQARDVSRAVCPQPFPPPDGEGGFDAVDRASRPPDMNARQRRPGGGAAAAREACGLGARPRGVPQPSEGAVEKGPASTNAHSGAERGRRRLDCGGYHGERGEKERPGEGGGGPKPVNGFPYDAEYVCKGGGLGLWSGKGR